MKMLKASYLQTRSIDSFVDHPGLTEQLLEIQGLSTTSWYPPSIREALAVPAIFRAVTIISNLTGSFSMQAFRNGVLMEDTPRIVSKPSALDDAHDFYRDTAYNLATRGEYIWWEAAPGALLNLPLHEVSIEWNQAYPLMRKYRWRNRDLPIEEVTHRTFLREPGALRGSGPLQVCGAAISVAVEATEWAARFFQRGGAPSVQLISEPPLAPGEAGALVDQWLEREGNEVRVTSGGVKAEPFQVNPEAAQLLESRRYSAAEAATMFGMDAGLLNAAVSGSSLTYQNVGQRFDDFLRGTLVPNYLEPIEHGISTKLTRPVIARFNVKTLLRADPKTQADIFSTLVAAGMERNRAEEISGIGSLVDTEPVPTLETVDLRRVPTNA